MSVNLKIHNIVEIKSTVRARCGCGKSFATLEDAFIHAQTVGHTLDIQGQVYPVIELKQHKVKGD